MSEFAVFLKQIGVKKRDTMEKALSTICKSEPSRSILRSELKILLYESKLKRLSEALKRASTFIEYNVNVQEKAWERATLEMQVLRKQSSNEISRLESENKLLKERLRACQTEKDIVDDFDHENKSDRERIQRKNKKLNIWGCY